MTVPHFPAELHSIICSYLEDEDLQSYRRASKRLALIGTRFLFQNITFHASEASTDRLISIASQPELRKAVKRITWDTDVYCREYVPYEEWESDERPKVSRDRYDQYRRMVAEENTVLKRLSASWLDFIYLFSSLKTLVIGNDYGNNETCDCVEKYCPYRLYHPKNNLSGGSLGRQPNAELRRQPQSKRRAPTMQPVELMLQVAPSTVEEVKILSMVWPECNPAHLSGIENGLWRRITRLDLIIENHTGRRRPPQSEHLKLLLLDCDKLRTLQLDFGTSTYDLGVSIAPAHTRNILPLHRAWNSLTNFTLRHADTSAEHIVQFLINHSTSLRALTLEAIDLSPDGSWPDVFSTLQPYLSLKEARFRRRLLNTCKTEFGDYRVEGWTFSEPGNRLFGQVEHMNENLSSLLENFLINGGECPLTYDNQLGSEARKLQSSKES
jgi:hypothetical protein